MEIARAWPDRQIKRRDGFQIVIEHIGLCFDHNFQRALLAQEIGRKHLDRGLRAALADGADGVGEMPRATVGEIVAIDRGDHNVRETKLGGRFRDMGRFVWVERARQSGLHIAEAQARVQVSPMIMNVACFFSQHSPIFGQPASSHTVCRPLSRIIFCVAK